MTLQEEIKTVDKKFDDVVEILHKELSEIQSLIDDIAARHNMTSKDVFDMCSKLKEAKDSLFAYKKDKDA